MLSGQSCLGIETSTLETKYMAPKVLVSLAIIDFKEQVHCSRYAAKSQGLFLRLFSAIIYTCPNQKMPAT